MQLKKLREIAEECKKNPNYHYRHLSDSEYLEEATKSFSKLTESQRAKVYTSWTNILKKYGEDLNDDNVKQLFEFRFLSQTNLYFLCKL